MKILLTLFLLTAIFLFVGIRGAEAQQSSNSNEEKVAVVPNRASVSELKLRGRIQGQFANSAGNNQNAEAQAGNYNSFEMRRIRFGVQGKVYNNWNFMVEANVLSTVDLDIATLTYAAIPGANVTFGKAKPRFGHEQNISSANILTFERTRLDGHLNGGKPLGLRLHGQMGLFSYYLGIYNGQSVGTGRMSSDQNTYLYNASLGMNIGDKISKGLRADFRADFLHTPKNTGYYDFENAFAVSGHFGSGLFNLRTEYMTGHNHENEVIKGFYVLPSYYIVSEKLQAVLRYENVTGDSGVNLGHNRYADRVPNLFGSGNEYNSIYTGVNYYIHGHNLKFMVGIELAKNSDDIESTDGTVTTLFGGFRMQF